MTLEAGSGGEVMSVFRPEEKDDEGGRWRWRGDIDDDGGEVKG